MSISIEQIIRVIVAEEVAKAMGSCEHGGFANAEPKEPESTPEVETDTNKEEAPKPKKKRRSSAEVKAAKEAKAQELLEAQDKVETMEEEATAAAKSTLSGCIEAREGDDPIDYDSMMIDIKAAVKSSAVPTARAMAKDVLLDDFGHSQFKDAAESEYAVIRMAVLDALK